jgi:hypothetical protein
VPFLGVALVLLVARGGTDKKTFPLVIRELRPLITECLVAVAEMPAKLVRAMFARRGEPQPFPLAALAPTSEAPPPEITNPTATESGL